MTNHMPRANCCNYPVYTYDKLDYFTPVIGVNFIKADEYRSSGHLARKKHGSSPSPPFFLFLSRYDCANKCGMAKFAAFTCQSTKKHRVWNLGKAQTKTVVGTGKNTIEHRWTTKTLATSGAKAHPSHSRNEQGKKKTRAIIHSFTTNTTIIK